MGTVTWEGRSGRALPSTPTTTTHTVHTHTHTHAHQTRPHSDSHSHELCAHVVVRAGGASLTSPATHTAAVPHPHPHPVPVPVPVPVPTRTRSRGRCALAALAGICTPRPPLSVSPAARRPLFFPLPYSPRCPSARPSAVSVCAVTPPLQPAQHAAQPPVQHNLDSHIAPAASLSSADPPQSHPDIYIATVAVALAPAKTPCGCLGADAAKPLN